MCFISCLSTSSSSQQIDGSAPARSRDAVMASRRREDDSRISVVRLSALTSGRDRSRSFNFTMPKLACLPSFTAATISASSSAVSRRLNPRCSSRDKPRLSSMRFLAEITLPILALRRWLISASVIDDSDKRKHPALFPSHRRSN